MKFPLVIFFIFDVLCFVHNYKILALFPNRSPSHFLFNERLFMELAKKGHEMDVVSIFPRKDPLPRYNDISIKGHGIESSRNNFNLSVANLGTLEVANLMVTVDGVVQCEKLFKMDAIKNLKNTTTKYDLLLTELFGSDCTLGFGHYFQIPVVATVSSVMYPWGNERFGNPDNPSYIPNYFLPYTSKMNLLERLWNTVYLGVTKMIYDSQSVEPSTAIARKFFGENLPDLRELARNTSLVLVNSHHSLHSARPVVPNFVEVAGMHIGDVKSLPPHLEKALNDSRGVIYLSMGSMLKAESMDQAKLQGLFDAFEDLPYTVLFKGNGANLPSNLTVPKNVHFETWLPQLDVLCHENVKLFITHGGLLGSQEAVYCGVPILGIPAFADQYYNLRQAEKGEFGKVVLYNRISKKSILEALKPLLDDPKYKSNAERISRMFKDRQSSPVDTAVYWIEYVIRYKGAPQLRSVGADLAWYQYLLIDVFSIIAVSLFTLSSIIYYLMFLIVMKVKQIRAFRKIKTS